MVIDELTKLITKRYEVATHSIALIDHKNVDIVGIPLTEINGNTYESHDDVVHTTFNIKRIIETFKNNIPISIRRKSNFKNFVDDLEMLIYILNSKKSRNMSDHIVFIPDTNISLEDIITFYNTLVYNNKKTLTKQVEATLNNGFNLIPGSKLEDSTVEVNSGNNFIESIANNYGSNKPKKLNGGIRDDY